jgi:hypothetical protein
VAALGEGRLFMKQDILLLRESSLAGINRKEALAIKYV